MRKGISLITFIITIVVIVVLSTIVIMTLASGDQVNQAKIATLVTKRETLEDGIMLFSTNKYASESMNNSNISTKQIIFGDIKEDYRIVDNTSFDLIDKNGEVIKVYKLDKEKCIENGITYPDSPNGGAWYLTEKGKLYLVYDSYDKMEKWIKGNPSSDQTVENFALDLFVALKVTFGEIKINLEPTICTNESVVAELEYLGDIPSGYDLYYNLGDITKEEEWKKYDGVFAVSEKLTLNAAIYKNVNDILVTNSKVIDNIDKILPTTPTDIEITSQVTSLEVKASGSTDEGGCGIAGYKYSVDNVKWSDVISEGTSYKFEGLTAETEYVVYVKSVDNATNESEEAFSKTGNTSEVQFVEISCNPPREYTKSNVVVTLTYPQTLPEGYNIYYTIGYEEENNVEIWKKYNTPFEVTQITLIKTGIYLGSEENYIEDNEFNVLKISTKDITNIDKEPPTAPTNIEITSSTNSFSVKASGSVDTKSGLAGYQYSLDNSVWSTTIPAVTAYSISGLSSGTSYIVYARAIDRVTNISSTSYSKSSSTLQVYSISYNANGGNGVPGATTKVQGTNINLSTAIPARTGYSFLGWSTSSTATTAQYSAGAVYSENNNLALYAVWKIDTYTITYNANGGSSAPDNQTKTYGQNVSLSNTIPARTGYSFLGWSTSSTATTAQYSAGAVYSENNNLALYAVWKIDIYTITYDANGGSSAPASQVKNYGTNITLSTTIPVREFFTFLGWSTSPSGNVEYLPGATYTNNVNVTLYAIYKINSTIITMDSSKSDISGLISSDTSRFILSDDKKSFTQNVSTSSRYPGCNVYLKNVPKGTIIKMDGNGGGSDGSGAGADWYIKKCYQDGSSIKYQYSDKKDEFILPETTDILSVIGCGCGGPTGTTCSASGTLKMSMTFEGYEFTFEIK